jgi:hypothetical protein
MRQEGVALKAPVPGAAGAANPRPAARRISRHSNEGAAVRLSMTGMSRPSLADGTLCIWCGERTNDDDDGGSFLFLAKRDGGYPPPFSGEQFPAAPNLQGLQFFCHAWCFRDSVPEQHRHWIDGVLEEQESQAWARDQFGPRTS